MTDVVYRCCDPHRRDRLRALPTDGDGVAALNGLDFLEVVDGAGVALADRQRRLRLTFVHALDPARPLTPANLRIDGGERIRGIEVLALAPVPGDPRTLELTLDQPGDFSRYTLRLVTDADHLRPPTGFDPRLGAIEFSFKVQCLGRGEFLAEFDCLAPAPAPEPDATPVPDIDYLARDFQGLRRLMLDRLAALVPGYRGDNPADLGVTLVELLAFAADQRTYQQDAIATEAYLGTARRRVSVRRHARLLDYLMHDGCNARTFVQFVVADATPAVPAPAIVVPAGTPLLTRLAGQPAQLDPQLSDAALAAAQAVFETMEDSPPLTRLHNRIPFYTWDDDACTLPRGATAVTLVGDLAATLRPGHLLILEEVRGPRTGKPGDADPRRRHPVRLTRVDPDQDPLDPAVRITEVAWALADALPFDLPLATAVASGNVVLADHGRTIAGEDLGPVPEATLRRRPPGPTCGPACCQDDPDVLLPPRYRPTLRRGPLTQSAPYDPAAPASDARRWDVRAAVPAITALADDQPDSPWRARRDLLGAGRDTLAFVAETDGDGVASLRFGDGEHGVRPPAGARLRATYRIGNGPAGNLGAEALQHLIAALPDIVRVRNPLPASGGLAPETLGEVRLLAPHSFRRQERAVTEADYAAVAERHPQIQRAAAALRWTGSFYTAFVQADPIEGHPLDATARASLLALLDARRTAGRDVALVDPVYVPIELDMSVCARPGHVRGDVQAALYDVFSTRRFFHPDKFTFGTSLFLSQVYAAAQAVPGVAHVDITALRRQGRPDTDAVASGELRIGPREILRLDNDPNFAERGVLRIRVGGGK